MAIDLAGDQAGEDPVVVVLEAVDALEALDALEAVVVAVRLPPQMSRIRNRALRCRGRLSRTCPTRCSK